MFESFANLAGHRDDVIELIGHVGSNGSSEEDAAKTIYTKPDDALSYASESGCDALAVAIGTAHGVYTENPVLSIDVLKKITASCTIPLVLHGGSGLSDHDFRECIAGGISKVNIFTHNNLAAARAAYENYTEKKGSFELMPYITNCVKHETMHLIDVFGSAGRA